jgi:hypothetical protein
LKFLNWDFTFHVTVRDALPLLLRMKQLREQLGEQALPLHS